MRTNSDTRAGVATNAGAGHKRNVLQASQSPILINCRT
jgi:hypothetical protein